MQYGFSAITKYCSLGYVHIRRHLKKTAVPSLNLPDPSVTANKGKRNYLNAERKRRRQRIDVRKEVLVDIADHAEDGDADSPANQFCKWQRELKDLENRNIALLAELNKLCKESDPLYGCFG